MLRKEFIQSAKTAGYNVYKIKVVREKGYKGYLITWSKQLNKTTQTVETSRVFWEGDLSEIFNIYFSRH